MKYRKKPVVIEAIIFDGNNYEECLNFIGDDYDTTLNYPNIVTLEGVMRVNDGDYIIRGVEGEYYPCKPNIFKQTYEPVTDEVASEGLGVEEIEQILHDYATNHSPYLGAYPERESIAKTIVEAQAKYKKEKGEI